MSIALTSAEQSEHGNHPTSTSRRRHEAAKAQRESVGQAFQKGQSGNPGGKPKAKESLAEIAREATPKAMRTLIAIMENDKASFAVRAYCADKVITANHHSRTM
jgi:hypothetical protein